MSQPLTVITGASSGIGLSAARAFAAGGHALLLISRHIEPVAEFAGHPVDYAQVDVADYDSLEHAVRESEARYGGTECLVNNAGTWDARPFEQVDAARYTREIEINSTATASPPTSVSATSSWRPPE